MSHVIVGLDLSLTGTGMCMIQAGVDIRWKVIGTGPQDKKATTRFPDDVWEQMRLGKLMGQISTFATGATLVCIEDFAKMSGAGGGGLRIGLAYLVRYWLWKQNIPFVVIAPSTLKKFVVGKAATKGADGKMHGQPKEVIIREVFRMWGHEVDDDNAADAISLAYVGLALTGSNAVKNDTVCSAAVRAAQASIVADIQKKYPFTRLAPPATPRTLFPSSSQMAMEKC